MHKMSKESAGKIASLQSRIDRAKKKNKEIMEDLKNVLFDFYNGDAYESMKDLENVINYLKKEEKKQRNVRKRVLWRW